MKNENRMMDIINIILVEFAKKVNYVWEQRKFSELYRKVNEKNTFRFGVDKIISVANMYFKEDVKKPNDEYMRTYNIMRLGDIAFEGNKSKNFSHGRFVENTIGDGIVSHVFDVFRPVMDYDLLFWKYLINNENVMGRIMTRCTKASTMMTNLVAKDFLNENILVPTIEEQHKIGTYIDKLDHLITLHHRECIILRKTKVNDWEQRKLADIAIEILAGGDIDKEKVVDDGAYPIYANALTNDGIVGYYNDYYRVKAPAVTVTGRGEVGYAQVRMTDFTPVVRLLAIRSKHDCYFLENAINNHKIVVESTGVPQLTVPQLSSYDICFPKDSEEEKKIGAYYKNLDHLITLHQRKICIFIKKMPIDWEQRKLDDWGNFYYGRSCPKWSVAEDA